MKKSLYLPALVFALAVTTSPGLAQTKAPKSINAAPATAKAPVAAKPATTNTTTSAKPTASKPAAKLGAQSAAKPGTKPVTAVKTTRPTPAPASKAQPAAAPAPAAPAATAAATTTSPAPTPVSTTPAPVRAKYLNAGVGLAAYYGRAIPLGVSFEMDIKDNISVGGSLDYFRATYGSGGYEWGYTVVYAGARGSYHLAELLNSHNPKLDPYAGATLGYRYVGYHDNTGTEALTDARSGGLYLGIHGGARYLFSPKLGGFAEVGYGVSALRLGVTAKF